MKPFCDSIAGEELPGCAAWNDAALWDKADAFCRAPGHDKPWKAVANVSPSSLQGDPVSWNGTISQGCLIQKFFWLHSPRCPFLGKEMCNECSPKMKPGSPGTESNAWAEPGAEPSPLISLQGGNKHPVSAGDQQL